MSVGKLKWLVLVIRKIMQALLNLSGSYVSFGICCSFEARCIFGEECSFGQGCRFENKGRYIGRYPFIAFEGFGSRIGSKMYVYNLEQGIYVRCGCWLSTIAEFRQRVRDEQADTYYLDCADLAERKFNK